MYNYKTSIRPFVKNPIVISFDKNDNKYYQVGFTQDEHQSEIERSLLILQDRIHWKSPLIKEISVINDGDYSIVSNTGNSLFGDTLLIYTDTQNQDINLIGGQKIKKIYGVESLYYDFEINRKKVDVKNIAYTSFDPSTYTPHDNENVLILDDKSYIEKSKYEVTPVTLTTEKSSVTPFVFDEDDYMLTIENSDYDITFLVVDYEIKLNNAEEKISTINIMEKTPMSFDENGIIRNVFPSASYYDRITNDRVRFVISDFGRLISLTQFDSSTNNFNNSNVFVFSGDKLEEENTTVSIRVSLEQKNSLSNITTNF